MPGTASDSSVAEGTANGQREGRNGKKLRTERRTEKDKDVKRRINGRESQRQEKAKGREGQHRPRRAKHEGITRGGRTARLACSIRLHEGGVEELAEKRREGLCTGSRPISLCVQQECFLP